MQQLEGDPAPVDHPRQLHRTGANDVDPGRGVAAFEHERAAGVGLLTHLGGQLLDIVLAEGRLATPTQAAGQPGSVAGQPSGPG